MLGSVLFDEYQNRHTVYGVDKEVVNKMNHIRADITNYDSMEKIIMNIRPDVIINCAALIDIKRCEEEKELAMLVNAKAAGNLSYLAEKYRARIIYISSNMVFDGTKKVPYREYDPVKPANNYAASKIAGENETIKYCRKHIIIRTNIFGWKPGSFGHWLYDSITTNKCINLYSDLYFNCLYVGDMVKPIENMFTAHPGIYHITSRDSMSKYEFGNVLIKLLGEYNLINKNIKHVKYKDHNHDKIKRPYRAVLNCDKYEENFGRLPTMQETAYRFLSHCPYFMGYSDGMR